MKMTRKKIRLHESSLSRLFLFVIFMAGCFQICFAQDQQKIDSLLNVLKTAKEDTNKVKLLNELSKQYRIISYWDSAKKYSGSALLLSEKLNFKTGKLLAYNGLGIAARGHGDFSEALKNYNEALKLTEEIGNKSNTAGALINMGLVYWNQGNYPEALKLYFRGLKIDEELNNKGDIGIDYNNIANIYTAQGNYQEALKFYLLSLKIFEELKDSHTAATLYNNIGNIYVYQNNYAEGLKNLLASLSNFEKSGDKGGIAMTYNNLGEIYYHEENYSEALKSHSACLKIAEEISDKQLITASLRNIGSVYMAQKKFSEARKYFDDGLASAKEMGAKELIKDIYNVLANLDSAVGNYKQAFEHYKIYTIYKDSLFNETSSKLTAEMETKYETEKKEKEISLLNKDKEIQTIEIKKQKLLKNSFIGGLAFTLLIFFFGYRSYRARQVLRLQAIRNRIADDLHDDIGSTLNSISVYSEVAKQKSPTVVQELEQIGEASRKIIDAMSDIVWTINTKNDSFEQIILRLRSLTYNLLRAKNIEHSFRADESLNDMKLSMEERRNFYLIFKEALNNLVKYSNATRVSISLTHENNLITLSIRDNGAGFDVNKSSTGNGLLSMKSRAEEMKAELKIESEPGSGTNVELKLKT